jgi:hypothetical protein
MTAAAQHSRAWREPMMWLVAGLPLTSVIAGVWLVTKLSGGPPNDVVRDDVRRVSQVQVVDLAPDQLARQLGLSMLLSVLDDRLELRVAAGSRPENLPLRLVLAHPLDAGQDRELLLQPDGEIWHATWTPATDHDWNVTLSPPEGRWRITGRLSRGAGAAMLHPALAEP